jgi:hypothetical protein
MLQLRIKSFSPALFQFFLKFARQFHALCNSPKKRHLFAQIRVTCVHYVSTREPVSLMQAG